MNAAVSQLLLFLAVLALACGKHSEEPCQPPAPVSFDFVIFDERGGNYAENLPRAFMLFVEDKKVYLDIGPMPGPRTAYLTSSALPRKSLEGNKTFLLQWGLETKPDTLFVDLIAGEGCAPPRYQAVRLNGKTGTFEYGVGPSGAFVFRK